MMVSYGFAPLDDDSYLDAMTSSLHIGEISIDIWTVELGQCYKHKCSGSMTPVEQKVHEHSKKALAHCVK